jgi:hypothetical protein
VTQCEISKKLQNLTTNRNPTFVIVDKIEVFELDPIVMKKAGLGEHRGKIRRAQHLS